MNENDYVNRVLELLPRATPQREQIAMELRGHIAERMAQGQPLEAVFAQLGDPASLAESYRSAVPLEPASYGSRILAKLIDVFTVALIVGLPVAASWFVVPREAFPFVAGVGVAIAGFGFMIYTIVAEQRTGQTVGKRMRGLQVVTETGAPIGLGQSIVRQLPFVFSIIWIDALFALFTDRRQRAFEMLSKTCVVSAPGEHRVTLLLAEQGPSR